MASDNAINEFEIIRQVASILSSQREPEIQSTLSTIPAQDTVSQILSGSQQSRQQKRLKSAISYAAPSHHSQMDSFS